MFWGPSNRPPFFCLWEGMVKRTLTAVIVGAGHRAMLYARCAEQGPEPVKIVGVADPSELRRTRAA